MLKDSKFVFLKNHHFFSKEKAEPTIWYKEGSTPWKVNEALFSMGQMFKGYQIVSKYAKKKHIIIINQTKNSMIDAFEFDDNNK